MPSEESSTMEWNAGWFGLQLGGSVWLLVASVLLLDLSLETATLVFGCFLAPNAIGTWMWLTRERRSVYRSIRAFAPIVGAFSILAVYLIDRAGFWEAMSVGGPSSVSATHMYVLIATTIAGLLLLFRLIHFADR